jgi:hypothetical protein
VRVDAWLVDTEWFQVRARLNNQMRIGYLREEHLLRPVHRP